MRITKSLRGFWFLMHGTHSGDGGESRLVSESSAVDFATEDGLDKPGSSFLWVGPDHHLDRGEVRQVVACMNHWLEHGRLPDSVPDETEAAIEPDDEIPEIKPTDMLPKEL